MVPTAQLDELLDKHGVRGISIATIQPSPDGCSTVVPQCAGVASGACAGSTEKMFDSTWLQIASLSKTLGTAFAIEYFTARGIPMDSPVNSLLRDAGATFQLTPAPGNPTEWADQVTLAQLTNHTGLGMHYVNGVPLSEPMPPVLDLITGTAETPAPYGYASIELTKEPGTAFGYSGGGFLVLQHLLEVYEGKPIAELMAPFLQKAGATVSLGMSFDTTSLAGKLYAEGYRDSGELVQDGRLQFPPLAAGGLGSPLALAEWLRQLALAYKRPEGCGGVSHETAQLMLNPGPDLGSEAFMRAKMGHGVFIFDVAPAEVGQPPSLWMLHQAANDGFRGVYLVCFDGPDAAQGPRGFVVLSNGDNNAMLLNCEVSRLLLQTAFEPPLQGLDWGRISSQAFLAEGIKQEEVVNMGLSELVLNAFIRA